MNDIMEKLNYIKRTGMYVDKLRNGKTYDDQSGCMINNADMLRRMHFSDLYNFHRLSPSSIIDILRTNFCGFESLTTGIVDEKIIKCVILEIVN